jgi:hypothetical protein
MDATASDPSGIPSNTRLTYREDDENFKKRLNTTVQIGWVFNTAVTIMIILGVIYLLGQELLLGLLLGVVMAFFTTFHFTLIQVTHANRWEIFRNRFKMPRGIRGGVVEIMYRDIREIERRKGVTGEKVVVHLNSGRRISIDVSGQEQPIGVLLLTHRQYENIHSKRVSEISIPINAESQNPIGDDL